MKNRSTLESFHANWATKLADTLSGLVPDEYIVEEEIHHGPHVEIDSGVFEESRPDAPAPGNGSSTAVATAPSYAPPVPTGTLPTAFPDTSEVRVYRTRGGRTLVAAIELISPSNKDRPAERLAFASKCAGYLAQGVSLVVVDIVTERGGNLHNEMMRVLNGPAETHLAEDALLYAVAYRPVRRNARDEIDIWQRPLAVGQPLPTMPLRLSGELFVPVDLEATYQEACRKRRIIR